MVAFVGVRRGACVAGGAGGGVVVRGRTVAGALGATVEATCFLPGTVTILTFGAGGAGTVDGATEPGAATVGSPTATVLADDADARCWTSR